MDHKTFPLIRATLKNSAPLRHDLYDLYLTPAQPGSWAGARRQAAGYHCTCRTAHLFANNINISSLGCPIFSGSCDLVRPPRSVHFLGCLKSHETFPLTTQVLFMPIRKQQQDWQHCPKLPSWSPPLLHD